MNTNQQPKMRFRAGSVSCSLWENSFERDGRRQVMLKAELTRRFKDRDGNWQSSNTFSRSELPYAMYVLQKAYAFMIEHDVNAGEYGETNIETAASGHRRSAAASRPPADELI